MQWAHSRGGDVCEHPAPAQPVCFQSHCGLVPQHTAKPEAGLGGDKAVQRATSLHHIILVYKMYKSYSPIFSQGLLKVLLSPTRAEICRDTGARQAVRQARGREGILCCRLGKDCKGRSTLGAWLLRMVLRGHTRDWQWRQMLCEEQLPSPLAKPTCLHTWAGYSLSQSPWEAGLAENHFSLLSHPFLLIHSWIPGPFEDGETNVPEELLKGWVEVKKSVWALLGMGKAKRQVRKKIKPLDFTNVGGSFFGSSFWITSVWSHLPRNWRPPA